MAFSWRRVRSEEHTSELQSQSNLVCRLLLEKKKNKTIQLTPLQLDVTPAPLSPHSTGAYAPPRPSIPASYFHLRVDSSYTQLTAQHTPAAAPVTRLLLRS